MRCVGSMGSVTGWNKDSYGMLCEGFVEVVFPVERGGVLMYSVLP